jgi:hypothetical protein
VKTFQAQTPKEIHYFMRKHGNVTLLNFFKMCPWFFRSQYVLNHLLYILLFSGEQKQYLLQQQQQQQQHLPQHSLPSLHLLHPRNGIR